MLEIYNVAKRKKALTLSSENCRKDEAEKFYHSAFTENMLTVCLKREEWPASWQPSESLRVSSEQMVQAEPEHKDFLVCLRCSEMCFKAQMWTAL